MSLSGGVAPAILSHTEAFVQQETVVTTSNEDELVVNEVVIKKEVEPRSSRIEEDLVGNGKRVVKEVDVKTAVAQKQKLFAGDVTRCICEMEHDDGFMICCDKCL